LQVKVDYASVVSGHPCPETAERTSLSIMLPQPIEPVNPKQRLIIKDEVDGQMPTTLTTVRSGWNRVG